MRTFAMRLLGLIFLSSLGACCIEPIGGGYAGPAGALCYEYADGPACVHPYGYATVRGGLWSPYPHPYYRTTGYSHPYPGGHNPGHPPSHGGSHGGGAGTSHGGSQGSHSGGSHGGHH